MLVKIDHLPNYDNDFFESYNFTIKSDGYYIYRYFKKYDRLRDFLENGIYMSSAASFSDGMECVDKATISKIIEIHNSLNNKYDMTIEAKDKLKVISKNIKNEQELYYISCWYLPDKEHENELMWRSYGDSKDYGFLVKIKLKDFLEHLSSSKILNESIKKIIYGIVRYFNFKNQDNLQTIKYKAFRKHNSYSDERELRLVIKDDKNLYSAPFHVKLPRSFYKNIEVYLSPKADYNTYLVESEKLKSNHDMDLNQSELSLAYNLKRF